MPDTYTQLYVQFVFTPKGRVNLIPKDHREELHKFITGIVQNRGHKLLAIFCMPDHCHLFVGINPSQSISDLMRDVKAGSSNFINKQKWMMQQFNWQEGYGAFSYSQSQIDQVVKYILNQEEHHRNKTFREEDVQFLEKFKIDYKAAYLFDWIKD